jgi:ADP-ribosyl-[dinitrogen reductase] hydrolase
MALCLAESLIARRELDPKDVLDRYVRWWREGENSVTGRCFDIGITTRQSLQHYLNTGLTTQPPDPEQAGNGSLMRLAPVAIFAAGDVEAAERMADVQSRTTSPATRAHEACRLFAILLTEAMLGADKAAVLAPRAWTGEPDIAAIAAGAWRDEVARRDLLVRLRGAHARGGALVCGAGGELRRGADPGGEPGDDSDTVGAVTGHWRVRCGG